MNSSPTPAQLWIKRHFEGGEVIDIVHYEPTDGANRYDLHIPERNEMELLQRLDKASNGIIGAELFKEVRDTIALKDAEIVKLKEIIIAILKKQDDPSIFRLPGNCKEILNARAIIGEYK